MSQLRTWDSWVRLQWFRSPTNEETFHDFSPTDEPVWQSRGLLRLSLEVAFETRSQAGRLRLGLPVHRSRLGLPGDPLIEPLRSLALAQLEDQGHPSRYLAKQARLRNPAWTWSDRTFELLSPDAAHSRDQAGQEVMHMQHRL